MPLASYSGTAVTGDHSASPAVDAVPSGATAHDEPPSLQRGLPGCATHHACAELYA
eukprot:CAMPEP_0196754028 /NCGR_PEP_ID=MMETSP1091-20130531/92536_1 /TAXON_ID=302021 /ORGANISM="Rhodomonas sp., Strain CCMP768" /LENGTH=55 /DNA_ID=CAMNT_0042102223 /DNA_START=38 /DNA_END=205 /DNA_ORIENTATION=+